MKKEKTKKKGTGTDTRTHISDTSVSLNRDTAQSDILFITVLTFCSTLHKSGDYFLSYLSNFIKTEMNIYTAALGSAFLPNLFNIKHGLIHVQ